MRANPAFVVVGVQSRLGRVIDAEDLRAAMLARRQAAA
jgi:hypothetical protein